MTRADKVGLAAFLAVTALGMIFDAAGLWRMTLIAAAIHEAGHAAVYALCTRRPPVLRLRAGGVSLRGVESLSRRAELAVLCAGPAVNFAVGLLCFCAARARASYTVYFFSAVNLCVGAYNLLPLGTLDGSRILQAIVPPQYIGWLMWVRRAAAAALCAAAVYLWRAGGLPAAARVSIAAAAVYLVLQGLFVRADLW